MSKPVRAVDRRFSTTAFEYPGYYIAQAHGVVRGLTVRNPNAGKAILGAFASLGGGESSTYIEMAEKAREKAFQRLLENAAAVGGNAVIGVKFTGQELLEGMSEVMAYGTAVTLIPLPQQQQQQQQQQAPGYSQQPQQQPQYAQSPIPPQPGYASSAPPQPYAPTAPEKN